MPMDTPPDAGFVDEDGALVRVGTFSNAPSVSLKQYDSVDPAFLDWAATKGIDPGSEEVIITAFLEVDSGGIPTPGEERNDKIAWYLANHAMYKWLHANDMPLTKDGGKYMAKGDKPVPHDAD